MGLSQSMDARVEEEEEEEEEEEDDGDDDDEEKEDEDIEEENGKQRGGGGGRRGDDANGDDHDEGSSRGVKVAQEPERRPFEASTSPLTPQNLIAGRGSPGFQSGFGPSIRVWDPGHVLTPPHSLPPKPGSLPPHSDRRFVDAHPDTCLHVYLIRHAESNMNTSPSLIGGRSPSATLTVEGKRQARALGVFLLSQGVHFDSVFASPLERCKRTAISVCQELNFPEQKMEFSESLTEMSQGDWEGLRRSEIYTGEVLHKMSNSQLDFRAPGGESQRQVEFRMVEFFNDLVLPKPFFHKDRLEMQTDEMDKIKMPTASSSNGSSKGAYLAKGGSNKSRLQISTTANSNGNVDSSSELNGMTRVFASKTIYVGVFSHGMAIKCFLRGLLGSDPHMTHKICIDNTSVTLLKYSSSDGWQILRVNDTAHLRVI